MVAKFIRKNFVLRVDGRGYAGEVEEVNPPKITLKTEDFRAGGMDGTIKLGMGQEPMDGDFTMPSFDANVLALAGIAEGQDVPVVLREVLESTDGTVTAVIHTMRGIVTEMDMGTAKSGESGKLKVTMNLRYYKLQHGAAVVHEIDMLNMVRTINGVDQLAKQRAALAM
jgi:P2 family phage contractile tail tube protein